MDKDLVTHITFLKDHVMDKPKAFFSYYPILAPDHLFEPIQVWEVNCADISISPVPQVATWKANPSKGISLRFPRLIKISRSNRPLKLSRLPRCNSQDIIKNQNKDKKTTADDDFDF